MSSYYIIDNWYEEPDKIRQDAINSLNIEAIEGKNKVFGLKSYPGYRGKTSIDNLLYNKKKIESHFNIKIDPKAWIYSETVDLKESDFFRLEYDFDINELKLKDSDIIVCYDNICSNGAFQFCTETCKSWVHADNPNEYAAVIYLHPNPPPRCGTGFYQHIKTKKTYEGAKETFPIDEILNFNAWEEIDYVENVYNRCIIYDAKQFHTATGYFGTTPEDSRLFQVFFFSILS